MNGITESIEDEPGRWFESLDEAPPNTECHNCHDPAELMDEEKQLWCAPCAGEVDWEMKLSEAEDDALISLCD
jgi:Zn finger protein HypA/HybF involved in hydrogenase expression